MAEVVRQKFSSRYAFLLAAAGSAIGLGNLWRFPSLVERYGGGMFILIYIIATFTFGLILFITETALGRRTGKTIIEAYASLSSKYKLIGWFGLLVPILLIPYYCVLGGWVLRYSYSFFSGDIASFDTLDHSLTYFNDFISGGILDGPVIWFVIFGLVTCIVLFGSINRGLEKVCRVGMPVLLILVISLTCYLMTIPGIGAGLEKFFIPDVKSLSSEAILSAVTQVFYSLSLGQAIMIAFGSYMSKGIDIKRITRTSITIDTIIALLCGLMIVPIVFIAYGSGFPSGNGLMFVTMPYIFYKLPLCGFIGFVFFALVFIAAWTSAISLGEAIVGSLCDHFHIDRRKGVIFTMLMIFTMGWLSCLGYGVLSDIRPLGMVMLDFFDFLTCNIMMPINAVLLCIVVGYIYKPKLILNELAINDPITHPRYYSIMIRYICPAVLVLILVTGIITQFF